jgi:hypothetical protein
MPIPLKKHRKEFENVVRHKSSSTPLRNLTPCVRIAGRRMRNYRLVSRWLIYHGVRNDRCRILRWQEQNAFLFRS